MPSLHTATAILIFIALRDSPLWHRIVGFMIAVSIAASTIALGEHYIVDLIAACPLVLFTRSVCSINLPLQNQARLNGMIAGALITTGWIACTHAGALIMQAPDLLRCLAVASILTFLVLERQLDRAERHVDEPSLPTITASDPATPHPAPYKA